MPKQLVFFHHKHPAADYKCFHNEVSIACILKLIQTILFESEKKNIFKRVCHGQSKIVHKYIFHHISRTLVLDWLVIREDEDLSNLVPYQCLLMLLMHQVQTFPMCDLPWKLPYNSHFRNFDLWAKVKIMTYWVLILMVTVCLIAAWGGCLPTPNVWTLKSIRKWKILFHSTA